MLKLYRTVIMRSTDGLGEPESHAVDYIKNNLSTNCRVPCVDIIKVLYKLLINQPTTIKTNYIYIYIYIYLFIYIYLYILKFGGD